MGVEWMEIGVKVRKGVIFTITGCFRSVCNHPFLVSVLCFLIFLYRLSPFLFQLLLSASPILVCTAVLLGTLLSFGQPNVPEIEVEEKTTFEAVSIKTGVSGEAAIVEKNESFYVERFSERRWDEGKESTEFDEVRRGDSDDTAPLIEERSSGIDVNDGENWEGSRELGDLGYEMKTDWIEERLNNGEEVENHYASVKVDDEHLDSDDEKSEADSFDSEKVNVDSLDSPPPSPWTRVKEREEEEEDREEEGDDEEDDSDSGSERAESSSPDASMADIMPMLDELHPLLDGEVPRTVQRSHGGSDVASDKSGASCHESDDESENHEDLEVADDDNEDGEDEEDGHGVKEEKTKCAITWTEEDQKNLMDLGSSEIERNQRLENLILRRRARKMFADRNLIDLESSDLPLNTIAPISTKRQNPFDLNHEYYDDSGLPPIPGSAPSVMLQRRNPFDIPYDSSEERPDLLADGFQEEFKTSQPREPLFRRHESFNIGPSHFAPKRQDVKMRPYFVPEGSISEASTSSLFQRQSSELSESKMSSVPDTESIGSVTSVEDPEERKLPEEDNLPEVEVIERANVVTEEDPSGETELISQPEVDTEEDVHSEPEMISKIESVTDHVGHGSQSSEEEEDSLEIGELESQMEDIADHNEQGSLIPEGSVYHSNFETLEHGHSRDSSSSSLSEVSERIFTDPEGERFSMLEARIDDVAEEPIIFSQASAESADLDITSMPINDILHREPVYDTSPRTLSKNISSSSISSDVHPDKGIVSSTEREFETEIHSNVEMLTGPSQNLEHLQEDNYFVLSRDGVHEVNEPPFEGQLSAEHRVSTEEIVQSPNSNAGDDVHHAADEKFISTLSSEGNTSLFHDKAIHEPNSPHLNELQASSSASVDLLVDGQVAEKVNMPEVQELDHYISSNVNSPSSPEIISFSPCVIEPTTSHVKEHTIVEEVDEIKEIDDALLSELDNVGDFCIQHSGSGSSEFEKHITSIEEESLSPLHHAEISTVRDVEVHSVVVNRIDDALNLENTRDYIGMYEDNVDCISELQTSETTRAVNTEASRMEFNEIDGQNSPLEKVELTSEGTEIIGDAEVSSQGQVDTDIISGMPELEGSAVEDIDLAFKQILSSEIDQAELHNDEETVFKISESEGQSIENFDAVPRKSELASVETEIMVGGAKFSSHDQVDMGISSGMPELEARTIEDIDVAFNQITFGEVKKPDVLEPARSELHGGEDSICGIPESEVQTIEDDAIPKKTELIIETGMDTTSGMSELEASSVQDIDLAFKQMGAKEIEKPATLEPPQKELHNYEDTVPEKPELKEQSIDDVEDVQGGTDATSGITELEANTIEDIDQALKEIEKSVVLEPTLVVGEAATENSEDQRDSNVTTYTHDTSVHEVGPIEDADLDYKQTATEGITRSHDSVDHTLHVVESGETQSTSSELHVAEPILPEDSILPPNQQLKLNSDDESVEVKADKVGLNEKSIAIESNTFEAEKPEHEAKAPEDLQSTSSVKGKDKVSKSSSSSSSSSSESSSSDSDGE